MTNYIDGFVFPVPRRYLDTYRQVAEEVAEIWKAYGAISYLEFVGDDLYLDGTKSFVEAIEPKEDEVIVFGWITFPSRAVRDEANQNVANDPRMAALMARLSLPGKLIFDASRMIYGGFKLLIPSNA